MLADPNEPSAFDPHLEDPVTGTLSAPSINRDLTASADGFALPRVAWVSTEGKRHQ